MGALTDDIPGALAAILPVDPPSPCVNCDDLKKIDYRIELKKGGNRILTPLEIPDFSELPSGKTNNTEKIDFVVTNRKDDVDSLTLEVLDGDTVIYGETNTAALLPKGEHPWQWDGYSDGGILNTQVLKSGKLKIRLIASKGGDRQMKELKLSNEAKIGWVDAKIDRNAKTVEVTVRPGFTDGGVNKPWFKKTNPAVIPKSYADLLPLAKQGIEKYWSRDGSRGGGIGESINTAQGAYVVRVIADIDGSPKADSFKIIENLADENKESRSAGGARLYHNATYWTLRKNGDADERLKRSSGHEFGHFILNVYAEGSNPDYSWTHKGTSTGVYSLTPQKALPNTPIPKEGEIDLMKYSDEKSVPGSFKDYFDRTIAAEEDVKGLIWITGVIFK